MDEKKVMLKLCIITSTQIMKGIGYKWRTWVTFYSFFNSMNIVIQLILFSIIMMLWQFQIWMSSFLMLSVMAKNLHTQSSLIKTKYFKVYNIRGDLFVHWLERTQNTAGMGRIIFIYYFFLVILLFLVIESMSTSMLCPIFTKYEGEKQKDLD
jgi:hypothetical protein